MDKTVLAAMAKWPNVPAVFGWLRLDARGQWWLRDEKLTQPAIGDFFRRNYARDAEGRYYIQNGPQKVYVTLDAAPYVVTRTPAGWCWLPDIDAGTPRLALLDDDGSLYLEAGGEIAVLDDRDLLAISECIRTQSGQIAPGDRDWHAWRAGLCHLQLMLPEGLLPLLPMVSGDVAQHYGVVMTPVA